MSKPQQFIVIARDSEKDTLEKIEMIRTILRKMAFDKGQMLVERCVTVDEYEKELRNQAEEEADRQNSERITEVTEEIEENRQ
jgi:hypothetical protein